MSGIRIPVSVELDSTDVTKAVQGFTAQFNQLGAQIAAANKVAFNPISKATLDDMKKLEAQFKALLKVNGDLRQRVQSTGQRGASFMKLDWEKLYPGELQRGFQRQRAFEHVSGGMARFSTPGGGNVGGSMLGGVARQMGGAALNAMGPAGGVANGAINTGASNGMMAGLAGLGGGLAALAIGKAVGAVVEKVGAVEAENIRHDRIKRSLGDTGVGFNALKASIRGASGQMGVTFDEGQDLVAQYIKTAGISNKNWRSAGDETATAGNFGRSFGVDQSQAVGAFGALRLSGVTNNDQQARRVAMLIGEGIAKSDAFSKADEVLDAIAGYTSGQTRSGMNVANVEGYTSMLTGMVGSKLPGMDVASSAALLSRMNSSISGGGAAGEAGQNFLYSALGGKGMDPMDVTVLREQGLFGTGRGTFGAGSAYGRYASKYGLSTPDAAGSDTTNFEAIQKQFEKSYGGSANARKLMANAMANLYGITNSQAMAISTVNPAQLGGMGKRLDRLGIDVKDVNATGISSMAQIEGDSSLSEDEKDKRMRHAATVGQEQTQGSIAKDSKAALENIKSTLADKLIPLTQGVRDGIMFLAGDKGKMSGRQIQEAMMTADSNDNTRQIRDEFAEKIKEEAGRPTAIRTQRDAALADLRRDYNDPEKRAAGQAKVAALSQQLMQQEEDSRKRVLKLQEERVDAIKKEADALAKSIKTLGEEEAARRKKVEEMTTGSISQPSAGAGRGFVNPGGIGGGGRGPVASSKDAQEAIDYFVGKGWSREQASGIVANLMHESKMRADAIGDGGQARGIAQWHPDRQADFKKWAGKDITESTRAEQMGFVNYELTDGKEAPAGRALRGAKTASEAGGIVSRRYERPDKAAQEEYVRGLSADKLYNTPMPDTGKPAGGGDQRVNVAGQAEIVVKHQYPDGRQQGPDQRVNVRLASPQASGM